MYPTLQVPETTVTKTSPEVTIQDNGGKTSTEVSEMDSVKTSPEVTIQDNGGKTSTEVSEMTVSKLLPKSQYRTTVAKPPLKSLR